jgi:uncharacterized damage-inducible protein DinB
MNQTEFLMDVDRAYAKWQTLLAQISPDEMSDPVMEGGWTLKDVIAHIAWYEGEMIGVLQSRALAGSELWELPNDERNASIYETFKNDPIDQILAQADKIHAALMPLLETLTDEELNGASHFAEMPPDWIPWEVIASNTSEHYRDHIPEVQNWLARKT